MCAARRAGTICRSGARPSSSGWPRRGCWSVGEEGDANAWSRSRTRRCCASGRGCGMARPAARVPVGRTARAGPARLAAGGGRPTSTEALLTGLKLARAENWLLERPQQLSADERQYVQASVERARAEARRRARGAADGDRGLAGVHGRARCPGGRMPGSSPDRRVDLARVALAIAWQDRDASKGALILTEIDNPDTPLATRTLDEMLRLPLVRAELPMTRR